jgi:hypothetical protein
LIGKRERTIARVTVYTLTFRSVRQRAKSHGLPAGTGYMISPPPIEIACPVIYAAPGLSKKTIVSATSPGVPSRPLYGFLLLCSEERVKSVVIGNS